VEPEARYTLVGAVLVVLVTAAAFAFVWLARVSGGSEFRYYTIYFEHQSLEGLQVGSDVNMQGIKVGRVEAFAIDRGNINRVNVKVRVARRTPVSTNTAAVVARNLVTGIARINLDTPGTPGPELEEVRENELYPVIAEGSSDIDQFARTANSLVISAESALNRAGRFLDDDNRKAFAQLLASLREVSAGMNRRLDSIDRSVVAFGDAARSLQKNGDAVTALAERLGTQAGPLAQEAQGAFKDTRATLTQIQAAARDVADATQRLEKDSSALARRANDVADAGSHELRATAQQLRVSMELLTRTLDRLQDPRAALFGPGERQLGPGEALAR